MELEEHVFRTGAAPCPIVYGVKGPTSTDLVSVVSTTNLEKRLAQLHALGCLGTQRGTLEEHKVS